MNKSKKEIQPKLEAKLNTELKNYKTELFKESKNEIFEHSYQTTIKEEIKNFILDISINLNIEALEDLYNTDNLLNTLYDDWLKYDSPFSINLENCIFESVDHIKKRHLENYEK